MGYVPDWFRLNCSHCNAELFEGDLVYLFDGGYYCSLECRDAVVEQMTDTARVEEIYEGECA